MNKFITAEDQIAGSTSITVGTTSISVLPARSGTLRRTQFSITNSTAGASMKVNKGTNPASATAGLPLAATQTMLEGDDGGYTCYQGELNVYSDVPGTVIITEMLESRFL
jgi:hypothetical protein